MLGVDPKSFAGVAYFRDDFAGDSLRSLHGQARADGRAAAPAACDLRRTRAGWASGSTRSTSRAASASTPTSATPPGATSRFALGPDGGVELPPGWSFLVADLTRPSPGGRWPTCSSATRRRRARSTVVSLSVRFVTRVSAVQGTVQLDDLQSFDAPTLPGTLATDRVLEPAARGRGHFANWPVIADFESTDDWEPMQGLLPVQAQRRDASCRPAGRQRARAGAGGPVQGQRADARPAAQATTATRPLPVLASEGFLETSGLKVGDVTPVFINGAFLDVRIVGTLQPVPDARRPAQEPADRRRRRHGCRR